MPLCPCRFSHLFLGLDQFFALAPAESSTGQTPLAVQYCKITTSIHAAQASKPDLQNTILNIAYTYALSGDYDGAFALLHQHNPAEHKTLRLDQTFLGFAAMIQLRKAIHRCVKMSEL